MRALIPVPVLLLLSGVGLVLLLVVYSQLLDLLLWRSSPKPHWRLWRRNDAQTQALLFASFIAWFPAFILALLLSTGGPRSSPGAASTTLLAGTALGLLVAIPERRFLASEPARWHSTHLLVAGLVFLSLLVFIFVLRVRQPELPWVFLAGLGISRFTWLHLPIERTTESSA